MKTVNTVNNNAANRKPLKQAGIILTDGSIDMSGASVNSANAAGTYEREIASYRQLSKVARKNGIVLFGSSFAKAIPVGELKQAFELDCDIYNRSLTDLSVFDAEALIDECVIPMVPKKVFLQLGETDLERGYRTIPEMIEAYEKVIRKLHKANKRCQITLVSVCNNGSELHPDELNRQIEALAHKTKCKFADISPAFSNDAPSVKAFSLLRRFFRDRITDYDAMNYTNV